METNWVMIGILCLSAVTFLCSIISNYAIRGNDIRHLQESIDEIKKSICAKIDDLRERIERIENIFIKGGKS